MAGLQALERDYSREYNKTVNFVIVYIYVRSRPFSLPHRLYELSHRIYWLHLEGRYFVGVGMSINGKTLPKAVRSLYEKSRIDHWNSNLE